MADQEKTPEPRPKFDFDAYPPDSVFHERRERIDHLLEPPAVEEKAKPVPRVKKERRRRIDPTTFEKQYTADELEFMSAMQTFKVQSGKTFPSYGEVLNVVHALGYRRKTAYPGAHPPMMEPEPESEGDLEINSILPLAASLPFVRLAD